MAEPLDVVVVGAAGMDTCVYLPESDLDWSIDGHFTDNRDGVGHAGGYAARGYAALGLRTAFCGALGDDPPGDLVRRVLTTEGVDLSACFVDPEGTARSVNLVRPDGSRTAFYDGRGNPGPTWSAPRPPHVRAASAENSTGHATTGGRRITGLSVLNGQCQKNDPQNGAG